MVISVDETQNVNYFFYFYGSAQAGCPCKIITSIVQGVVDLIGSFQKHTGKPLLTNLFFLHSMLVLRRPLIELPCTFF
jgi:hypothetical protein